MQEAQASFVSRFAPQTQRMGSEVVQSMMQRMMQRILGWAEIGKLQRSSLV